MDPAFSNIGKEVGLVGFRIENKQVVPLKSSRLHELHTGDSYIFLHTSQKSSSNAFKYNIHFWLGSETSQDESGIAAYKTVELDEALGGSPVQYRECQNNESALFLSYFKESGLTYLEGGVASGFRHVDQNEEYAPRLYQIKGKRTARVTQVTCSKESLNNGDVFVLDKGTKIFLFNGQSANRIEKAKGVDILHRLRNDSIHQGKAIAEFMDEDPDNQDFWEPLGGQVATLPAAACDASAESKMKEAIKMFVLNADEKPQDITPEDKVLKRKQLSCDAMYLIDAFTCVYVWIGKTVDRELRNKAMVLATNYLGDNAKPLHTPVVRFCEGTETVLFESLFADWNEQVLSSFNFGEVARSNSVAESVPEKEIDVSSLHAKVANEEAQNLFLNDDGSVGDIKIWRIEDLEKQQVPLENYGEFFSGDSYIILYTYLENNREQSIIYFWQGLHTSVDEKGASALLTIDLDDRMLQGKAVQIRVTQGKEPLHFKALFQGKMVVRSGGHASGFSNTTEEDEEAEATALFHVKGTNGVNVSASQVSLDAANLNSGDCFIVTSPKQVFVWEGKNSLDKEKEIAQELARAKFAKDEQVAVVEEGEEDESFWDILGGKKEYPSHGPTSFTSTQLIEYEPSLFQCSNATGVFQVDEICNFAQSDLNVDDIFLLDTFTSVFIWIGNGANEQEKQQSKAIAQDYITAATDGRDKDCPVIIIEMNNEPKWFTCHFLGWDPKFFESQVFVDPYEARLAKLRAEKQVQLDQVQTTIEPTPAPVAEEAPPAVKEEIVPVAEKAPVAARAETNSSDNVFSYTELKTSAPASIEPHRKEEYLSTEEFLEVFGMSLGEFQNLPKWKQQAKKKEVGLF